MVTVVLSSEAGSMFVRFSNRLPRDSTSMRTKDWPSFFHIMRFCPEREKQNERCFGNGEPGFSDDVTDLAGREAFCILATGGEPVSFEKNPRFGLMGDMLSRIEGSL